MKFTKIVGFGDSWMYGDELLDPELSKKHADAHTCWSQNDHYRTSNNFQDLGIFHDSLQRVGLYKIFYELRVFFKMKHWSVF